MAWGSYFFGYNLIKDRMRRQGAAGTQLSHTQHLVAATAAGACTLVVTNPIWVVKTRMCLTVAPGHTEYRSLSRKADASTVTMKIYFYEQVSISVRRRAQVHSERRRLAWHVQS